MGNKLPNNWIETNIKTVSVISRGVSYQKNQASATSTKDAVYILRGGNIQDGQIDFDTDDNVYINGDLVNEIQLVKKYDVVIVGSTGSKKHIGKAGIALNDFTDVSFGAFLMMLRTKVVDKKFHSYFFQTKYYRDTISQLAGGVAINNIRKEHLENLFFPLPPLAEQERIVAKVDALFGQYEAMKKALEHIPQLLKDFRQKVLNQAVIGELTNNFDHSSALAPIVSDREAWFHNELETSIRNGSKKPQKIVLKTNNDISFLTKKLNKKLDITFIEEISAKKDNALKAGPFGSSLKKEFYTKTGYKIYGQEQVIKGDAFYGDYYIDSNKFEELKSCRVQPKDLLISLVGTIGKVLVLPPNCEEGIINPRLLKFSFHESVNPYFIKIYLESDIAKEFLSVNSRGGTMDVLNLGILKQLPIPLPSLQEQQEIISRVESLFAKADKIEEKYKVLKAKLATLPQAILHKAFKGELVTQLATDGDARDLLAEITALKSQAKKKK